MLRGYAPRKIDPNLKRDLMHGWMIPYLLAMDELADGRWDYWCRTIQDGALLDEPIPQVEWYNEGLVAQSPARRHIEECLDLVANTGTGAGWAGHHGPT
ncbi:MAG: hypothetical protein HC853_00430 [Anaerolineae bacterium]|nr:hypothetical protein [Anaerolineae bacterium]